MTFIIRQFRAAPRDDGPFEIWLLNAAEDEVGVEFAAPPTPTEVRLVNEDDPSLVTVIRGVGLAFSGPQGEEAPSGGTINAFEFLRDGAPVLTASGASIPFTAFGAALDDLADGDEGPLDALVEAEPFDYSAAQSIDPVVFEGENFDDILVGSVFDDTLAGDDGNDRLEGGDGNDQLLGDDDFIELSDPFPDNDTLIGGAGNDFLWGGRGVDRYDGGDGFDYLDFIFRFNGIRGVRVDLPAGRVTDPFGNVEIVANIEEFDGTIADDVYVGDDGDNYFRGQEGVDSYDGGGGYDVVGTDRNGATQGVVVDLGAGALIDEFGNTETLVSIEEVSGTILGDSFTGSDDNDFFEGRAGADSYDGGAGDFDQVSFDDDDSERGAFRGAVVDLAAGTGTDPFGNAETFAGVEMLRGSPFGDSFTGGDERNTFRGLAGADTLDGGGGDGDEVRYDRDEREGGSGGVTVNLDQGFAIDGFGATDTLLNIERAQGTRFDDVFVGDDNYNWFRGFAGADSYDGGAGGGFVQFGFQDEVRGAFVNLGAGVADRKSVV